MKTPTRRIHVTFRNTGDSLACMFEQTFKTVAEAKAAIEADAEIFLAAHRIPELECIAVRQSAKWVDPKNTDYYRVRGRDGNECIYQYFNFIDL